ncbi:MAG: glycosyltransferase family 9 protein [Actinomycetota bacterium]|nr:glycosyltransferase family 9 protein [Actinomycetota bacterium]
MTGRRPTVLVARLDADGDVLLAGPTVRAVAAAARVVLLVGPRGRQAGALLPGVDELLVWAAPWIEPAPAPAVTAEHVDGLVRSVRSLGVDRAVLLTSFHQSALPLALILRLAGVRHIGAISEDYPGSLLDVRVPDPGDRPEPERGVAVAAANGFPLPAGDDGRLAVRRPLPDTAALTGPGGYVVLHPGTSVTARAWPEQRWAETAQFLSRQGVRVVVTGGPPEAELTARVAACGGQDLGGRTTLPELADVLARAAAVVVANTGPAHLAAAVGTPVVSLFAPTVPAARWAPYGVPVALLGDQLATCRGTRATTCQVPGHPCLTSVTAADVAGALADLAEVAA